MKTNNIKNIALAASSLSVIVTGSTIISIRTLTTLAVGFALILVGVLSNILAMLDHDK